MLYDKKDLITALKNEIIDYKIDDALKIDHITIDNRQITQNSAFIAIKGKNHDGHNFISPNHLAIIDDKAFFDKSNNIILVKNTQNALNALAKFARARSNAKIIAVTGSVGKTSTKEMLKNAFEKVGVTHATAGNLNNHLGLPLTICNMAQNTEFAIFELGMNAPGEISPLSKLAKPDIAIITNIAAAHIGSFDSEAAIAKEKSAIFDGLNENGTAIIPRDDRFFEKLKTNNYQSFGTHTESNYRLISHQNTQNSTKITVKTINNGEISCEIGSINQGVVKNALIVIACLDLVNKNFDESLKTLITTQDLSGRAQIIEKNGVTIIDDSYNANLASMQNALQYLFDMKKSLGKARSIAILGDMAELGDKSDEMHQKTLEFAADKADLIITCGEIFEKNTKTLAKNYKNYINSKEIAKNLPNFVQKDDILLIKGSRSIKMEDVIK